MVRQFRSVVWLAVTFHHLFVYLLNQYSKRFLVLLPLYWTMHLQRWHHAVLVLFVIFGGLFQLLAIYIDLHRVPLAILVVISIAVISVCCSLFTVNDSGIVGYRHEHRLLAYGLSFRRAWRFSYSSRQLYLNYCR